MAPILASGTLVGHRYQVVQQLPHYKELFRCVDTMATEGVGKELILKVEPIVADGVGDHKRLENEYNFYRRLSTTKCFDFVVNYLTDRSYRYLLMKPLGQNLYDIYKERTKRDDWPLEVVVKFAEQMISRVASCHLRGVLHRDIKPENFVVDPTDGDSLYLIDFNLAKMLGESGAHIPYRKRNPRHSVGNVRFLSVNAHNGDEQSRRDDLISVGYSLIYLAKRSLPWSHLRQSRYPSREHYLSVIGPLKNDCTVDELCLGLPDAFKHYMNYCLGLHFQEPPKYVYLRQLFTDLLTQMQSSSQDIPTPEVQSVVTIEPSVVNKHLKPKTIINIKSKLRNISPPMICP